MKINPYNDNEYDYTFCKENIEDVTYEDLKTLVYQQLNMT